MTNTKRKSIFEWFGIIVAAISILTAIMAFSKKSMTAETNARVDIVERKIKPIPGMQWDFQYLERGMETVFPDQMKRALADQIQHHGPRPETKEDE